MHELGVTKALYDMVIKAAKENEADKIREIYLVLGIKSGIEPECVDYYFSLLAEGSPAEGAKLIFSPAQEREFYIDRMEIEQEEEGDVIE